ncbi:MAG: phosphoenolpyruvate--protein phosphotransferase [Erythrobacter sp.]
MAGSAAQDTAQVIVIGSPAQGWAVPLDAVPDPAFSSGALGGGIAIELLDGLICAPCDGHVAAIANARHAITIETGAGAQILIHCGIDTVALDGVAFEALVIEGCKVSTGDPLMRVDLEAVARAGKSLATPVVLVEAAGYSVEPNAVHGLIAPGAALYTLKRSGAATTKSSAPASFTTVRHVTLPMPHGLHARPAAAIAAEAERWASALKVELGDKSSDARSTTGLMKLGAVHGSMLAIHAGGQDAEAAAEAIASLIEAGAGDNIHAKPPVKQSAPATLADPLETGAVAGVGAAPGQALGPAYYLHRARIVVNEASQGVDVEQARLAAALVDMRKQLSADNHGIAAAHLAIIEDRALVESVTDRIAQGESAAVAWQQVMGREAAELRALPDPRLAERADDFADLEQQLLRMLTGKQAELSAPAGSIVIASDLYPSDLAPLAAAGIAGIATLAGGPTSHLAILSASAGIPMAVAFGKPLCQVEEGDIVHLDGDRGRLRYDLNSEERQALSKEIERREAAYAQALDNAREEARLASGERIEVFGNLGSVEDADEAVALCAEGSGLLRTEFLFLDRESPPSEDEQAEVYRAIIDRFDGKPVIIRTLDIGADKPAPYLELGEEDNPALGVRGIRIGLRDPQLLRTQISAILRASGDRVSYVMAPMVSSLREVEALRDHVDEIAAEVGHIAPIKLGAMVETPASALIADALIKRLDFLSVGTNDLTQYTLAADRTNPDVATQLDPMHPAVLRLIAMTGEACSHAGKPLGVCGGAAGDHVAAAVLVGLGVTELSVSAALIPELKQHLRRLTMEQCRAAAAAALGEATPDAARSAVEQLLNPESEG